MKVQGVHYNKYYFCDMKRLSVRIRLLNRWVRVGGSVQHPHREQHRLSAGNSSHGCSSHRGLISVSSTSAQQPTSQDLYHHTPLHGRGHFVFSGKCYPEKGGLWNTVFEEVLGSKLKLMSFSGLQDKVSGIAPLLAAFLNMPQTADSKKPSAAFYRGF